MSEKKSPPWKRKEKIFLDPIIHKKNAFRIKLEVDNVKFVQIELKDIISIPQKKNTH